MNGALLAQQIKNQLPKTVSSTEIDPETGQETTVTKTVPAPAGLIDILAEQIVLHIKTAAQATGIGGAIPGPVTIPPGGIQ